MWGLLLLALPSAQAFELITNDRGIPVSWSKMPVEWSLNADSVPEDLGDDAVYELVAESLAEWEAVEGAYLWFEYAGETDIAKPAHDKQNVVYFEDDWEWDNDILALTSTWSAANGDIVGFDVRVNTSTANWGQGGMDLQNAMTHELGHAIGLDHTPEFYEATMFATTRRGELRKRDLHWDDQDGARALYPDSGSYPRFRPGCSTAPLPASLTMTLAGLLLAAGRRRR